MDRAAARATATARVSQGHRALVATGRAFRRAGLVAGVVALVGVGAVLGLLEVWTVRRGVPDAASALVWVALGLAAPAVVAVFAWACHSTGRLIGSTADAVADLVLTSDLTALAGQSFRLRRALLWLRSAWRGSGSIPGGLTAVLGRSKAVALLVNPGFLLTVVAALVVLTFELVLVPALAVAFAV